MAIINNNILDLSFEGITQYSFVYLTFCQKEVLFYFLFISDVVEI